MTTQVRIENLGPDQIKVCGHGLPVMLAVGETIQMYVHQYQDISINEVKSS